MSIQAENLQALKPFQYRGMLNVSTTTSTTTTTTTTFLFIWLKCKFLTHDVNLSHHLCLVLCKRGGLLSSHLIRL